MLCKKCGTDNPISRIYCDNCGTEIQHDLGEIQAAVDGEIKRDKAKATTIAIRWLLGVSFVLFVIGIAFRNAYKDLPVNDIVPFIAAPQVPVADPPTVATARFGLDLPAPRVALPPKAPLREPAFKAKVADEAFHRAAVSVLAKGPKEPITGLIITDLTLQFTPTGEATALPIQAADIAALRPTAGGLWELTPRSLGKTLRGAIAAAPSLDLTILQRAPDGKTTPHAVPLRNIIEIKPLETEKP